ncbi:MAG: hypothetical protein V1660_03035 [archaeon]
MGLRDNLNDAFKKYASNNSNSNADDHDVQSRIGYLKEVLAGNRRKAEQGGYWRWKDRLKEAKKGLTNLSAYVLNEHEVTALKEIKDAVNNSSYLRKKKEKNGVKEGLSAFNSHVDNYVALYNKIKNPEQAKIKSSYSKPTLEKKADETVSLIRAKGLEGRVKKLAIFGLAVITAVGIALGGYIGGYNERDKTAQKEIAKAKQEYSMIIKTDLSSKELDKRYESYAKDKAAGLIPIFDLTKRLEPDNQNASSQKNIAKAESNKPKEVQNRGIFPVGYCYKKDIVENQKKRDFSVINEQARDIKESTVLLWHEDTRKHPRANDKYNHVKGKHAYHYGAKNLANTLDYVLGDGPDTKKTLFGDEKPLVSRNYEVSVMESVITGDGQNGRVDGLLSDITSIGSMYKASPSDMAKKTGDDAKQILSSAGKFIKNFFTLNWFGRSKNGFREAGAIENLIDTAVYTVKTPINAALVPLQAVPIVDANGIVEDVYHTARAVRGTAGSAAASLINFSQGTVDGVLVKPSKKIISPLGNGLENTNILLHDAGQFVSTGLSQLFEAELIAENIDSKKDKMNLIEDKNLADGAIYPYRQPSGMRYLYEAGKDIAAASIISGAHSNNESGENGSGSSGGIIANNPPGRSGGPGVSARSGGAGI